MTRIHITTAPARKKPKGGDRRYLKGRGVWQVRQMKRVPEGQPHAGAYICSNGRQLYEWVDESQDQQRSN
jgi:hypothetical protein